MLSHTLHRHPELMLFDSRSREIDAEISEAKAEKIPDWGVELAYQQRAPQFGNMASFQFTIGLPMFPESRQDPRIAAKIAEKEALDAEREAAFREHNAMLESDMAEYQRLKDSVKRQKEVLLPLSEEKADLILADWNKIRLIDEDVRRLQQGIAKKAVGAQVLAARRDVADLLLLLFIAGHSFQPAKRRNHRK